MKRGILTLLLLTICSYVVAQSFEWAKSMGGSNTDIGYSIAVDTGGNVYTIGSFRETVNFNSDSSTYNLTSQGLYDIFIQKLDAQGCFLWTKSIGGTGWDYGRSIVVDTEGNIYAIGHFQNTVDFDPSTSIYNLVSQGGHDVFILKLDAQGNFIWAKSMGENGTDTGYSIAVDSEGNIYTTGHFQNTVDFNPNSGIYNLANQGGFDIYVQKLDSDGNFIWAKSMGGTDTDIGYSIAIDTSNNIHVTGWFSRTVDFDPSSNIYNLTSRGGFDIFIQKLDTQGNLLWAKSIGGSGNDNAYSIAVDIGGNTYTTGRFESIVDFDPNSGLYNLISQGDADIFIQKLDAQGNLLWAKNMGGSDTDIGSSITTDINSNVYTTGYFSSIADFDPDTSIYNITSQGGTDIFIQKLDAQGNLLWVENIGGVSYDGGETIIVDSIDNIYTIGSFQRTVDFDGDTTIYNLISQGTHDIFVQKLSQKNTKISKAPFTTPYLPMNPIIPTSPTGNDGKGFNYYNIRLQTTSNNIQVYPNPTSRGIKINLQKHYKDVKLVIRNTLGQTMDYCYYYNTQEINLNIEYERGIYFFELSSGIEKIGTIKVLKE